MLIAFFVTATISILAVLFAYLSHALDDASLNFLDLRVIDGVQGGWYALLPRRRERRNSLASLYRIDSSHTRGLRNGGVIRFVLALSDQQLVTGLAILFAAVANQKYFTRYELIVIHSLAWFSSTTHLATLDVLKHYLNSHKKVRAVRIVGIVIFLVLLLYCWIIRAVSAMLGPGMFASVQCVFILRMQDIHVAEYSNWHGTFNILWQCSWLIAILLVLLGYLIRIQDFYLNKRHPLYLMGWVVWKIRKSTSHGRPYSQSHEERQADLCLRRLVQSAHAKGLRRYLLVCGYDDSFLSSIPGIVFSFSYGVTQVLSVRFGMQFSFNWRTNAWGYGEIVSLLLLCLPFMAAAETISDYQIRRNRHVTNQINELTSIASRSSSIGAESTDSLLPHHRLREISDDFENLDAIETKYRKHLNRIKKYFCRDTNQIIDMKSSQDSSEMVRRKQAVLAKYECVEQYEKHISIVPHLAWFSVNVAGAMVLGVLLNAAPFDGAGNEARYRISFAIALFLAFLFVKTIVLFLDTVGPLQLETDLESGRDM